MRWCAAPGKHCFESALLGAFFSQSIDFWSILGSQGGPNWAPKSIPKRQNRILVPPGGPGVRQGAILGRFWVDFGGVLRPLGSILAPFWGYRGSKKRKLQHISENSSKQLQTAQKRQIIENRCKRQQILKAWGFKLEAWSLRLKDYGSKLKA